MFSPLLRQALRHHPAWHLIERQQVYLIVFATLYVLESRDAVCDTLAPFPLELVRGKEHLETFTLVLWSLLPKLCLEPGHEGFDATTVSICPSFSVGRDVSRFGQQLLIGHCQTNSSLLAAPFKPPTN